MGYKPHTIREGHNLAGCSLEMCCKLNPFVSAYLYRSQSGSLTKPKADEVKNYDESRNKTKEKYMFDEEAFMNTTSEGEMETEFTPVPVGEYQAIVKKVGTRSGEGDKGPWAMLDVTWAIDDAGVTEVTGMDNPSVRQSIFLDISESGGLDMGKGKNISLGRLREALGQNTSAAWSPTMLEGNIATVMVDHRMYDGRTFADVKSVSAI